MGAQFIQDYSSYYASKSLLFLHARGLPQGSIYTDQMYPDQKAYRSSETYNELFKPPELDHLLQVYPRRNDINLTVIAFRRSAKTGHYQNSEVEVLRRLTPHLAQAARIQEKFSDLIECNAALEASLDRVPAGVLYLNATGKVLVMSRAAQTLLAHNDGLKATRHGLEAARRSDNVNLQTLIGHAITTGLGMGTSPGGILAIHRPSRKRHLNVLVAPFTSPALIATVERPTVVVIIGNPDSTPELPVQNLRRLYGLTRREADVAVLMATGADTATCSERLGITGDTVRGYLKRIYSKTGTSRQAELVHLLLSIPPDSPLEPGI